MNFDICCPLFEDVVLEDCFSHCFYCRCSLSPTLFMGVGGRGSVVVVIVEKIRI